MGFCLAGYLFVLDVRIRTKFEAHRWNLPSRVYSDAFRLYPGLAMTASELEERLLRLSYKKVAGAPRAVGEYTTSGTAVSVYLHHFTYPSDEFTGFPVRMDFGEGRLNAMTRVDRGEDLKNLKLEPERIASIFDEQMEDRTLVTITDIPDHLIHAAIAVEDERFYSHRGVDPKALLRAILTDILHLKKMQGGSTITQQLVKNYFLTSKKSFVRKFNEMLMAFLLEARYTKEEIIESYLNEIYFGQRGPISVTGAQEGARLYFSKNVSDLDLAECALLAGLIRAPGEYSPYRNPEKARDRRNLVLKMMREQDRITEKQYQEARKEKIILAPHSDKVFQASFFIDFVRKELQESYSADILTSQGLRVFTTLDMRAQEIAEGAVAKRLQELEASRPKFKKRSEEGKPLQGLLLALQPQTGYIRAFVGGREYETSQFDRITDAHRQPGSALKPFVYLAALATGESIPSPSGEESAETAPQFWTLASLIDDSRFSVKMAGQDWTPENYDRVEHGPVRLRQALEESLNIATAKLAIEVGLDKIVRLLRDAGIESPLQPYPSLALGAFEVTPIELARAYTIFPNQGTRAEPIAVLGVMTRDGKVLERKSFQIQQVVSPEAAYLVTSALKGVLDRGTAASARSLGFNGLAAGKTGTTSDYRDSWFVGYTPDLLALSWVGFDDNTATGLSGSSGALPIWVQFMKMVNPSGASRVDFPATDKIILVKISNSGDLYRPACGEPIEEAFLRGTEPTVACGD